jgi:PKD repeat protein
MFRRTTIFSLGVLLLFAVASCDRVPLLAPSNSTISVSAGSGVVPTGGSTSVTATVLESSGTPVQNGTLVRFSTTLGRVDPVEAQTRNGIATSTFVAGTESGLAEVRATSGGAAAGTTTPPPSTGNGTTPPTTPATSGNGAAVMIAVGAGAVETVTVTANPAVVPSAGGQVTLTATVTGLNGRLLQGIPVTFSASRGTLSSSSATTDASGTATVTLTTSSDTSVTATAGSKTSTPATTITALVAPAVSLACAAGSANCSSVTPGQTVTFTASRTSGTIVTSTLDFGDGSSIDLGPLSGSSNVPHVYNQTGTFTARLTARDANGETSSAVQIVQVLAAATVNLVLSNAGLTVTATATPSVPATQYVWTFESGQTQTTTANTASFTYATAGLKTVTVTVTFADGRTATVSRTITI